MSPLYLRNTDPPEISLGARVQERPCYCGHRVPHRELVVHGTLVDGSPTPLWLAAQHCAYCGAQLSAIWEPTMLPHLKHHRCKASKVKQEGFAFAGKAARR